MNNLPWIVDTYTWTLFTIGIFVCVWAFKRTKTKGYLVMIAFFAMPYLRFGMHRISYEIHKDEYRQLAEIKNKELQEKLERGEPIEFGRSIDFPLLESLLTLGLFLTAKQHTKTANK